MTEATTTVCRVYVTREAPSLTASKKWVVKLDPQMDNSGMRFAWVAGMLEHYLRRKRPPKTMHEVHLLLREMMGSVPDEVEVVFDDYGIPPMRRGDFPHLTHRLNYGSMEREAGMERARYLEFLDGVDLALERVQREVKAAREGVR